MLMGNRIQVESLLQSSLGQDQLRQFDTPISQSCSQNTWIRSLSQLLLQTSLLGNSKTSYVIMAAKVLRPTNMNIFNSYLNCLSGFNFPSRNHSTLYQEKGHMTALLTSHSLIPYSLPPLRAMGKYIKHGGKRHYF